MYIVTSLGCDIGFRTHNFFYLFCSEIMIACLSNDLGVFCDKKKIIGARFTSLSLSGALTWFFFIEKSVFKNILFSQKGQQKKTFSSENWDKYSSDLGIL